MASDELQDRRERKSMCVGDVVPMNRGQIHTDLTAVKNTLAKALNDGVKKGDKKACLHGLLAGINKLEGVPI